jgi:hypothetical protein
MTGRKAKPDTTRLVSSVVVVALVPRKCVEERISSF